MAPSPCVYQPGRGGTMRVLKRQGPFFFVTVLGGRPYAKFKLTPRISHAVPGSLEGRCQSPLLFFSNHKWLLSRSELNHSEFPLLMLLLFFILFWLIFAWLWWLPLKFTHSRHYPEWFLSLGYACLSPKDIKLPRPSFKAGWMPYTHLGSTLISKLLKW